MAQQSIILSQDLVRGLLAEIRPGSTLFAIHPIGGDHYNSAFLVEVKDAGGRLHRLVIKQYKAQSDGHHIKKANIEFKTLSLLQKHDVPVPKPLYLDTEGTRLGGPGLVTSFIPGESVWTASDWQPYVRELALTLAKIHSISIDEDEAKTFLLDANKEALWFRRNGRIPAYMGTHPEGPAVWQAVDELLQHREPVAPILIHLDYWMGNLIWDQSRIAAVIDWEEAAYGDPAVDVGYCRMDMYLSRMGPQAADQFLQIYEAEMGRPTANSHRARFAASPRPMRDAAWEAEVRAELHAFIANTRKNAG